MRECFAKNDLDTASHFAHKMLPLFKMMGDEKLSDVLLKLDHKKQVSEGEKSKTISEICRYIDEAKILITEMEKA